MITNQGLCWVIFMYVETKWNFNGKTPPTAGRVDIIMIKQWGICANWAPEDCGKSVWDWYDLTALPWQQNRRFLLLFQAARGPCVCVCTTGFLAAEVYLVCSRGFSWQFRGKTASQPSRLSDVLPLPASSFCFVHFSFPTGQSWKVTHRVMHHSSWLLLFLPVCRTLCSLLPPC